MKLHALQMVLLEVHRDEDVIFFKQINFPGPFTNTEKSCPAITSTRRIFIHISKLPKEKTIKEMESVHIFLVNMVLQIPDKHRTIRKKVSYSHIKF